MTDDSPGDFFEEGRVYTDRKKHWAPSVPAVEFEVYLVAVNPSTGERVAFGWRRRTPGGGTYPDHHGEQDFGKFTLKEEKET